MRKQNRDWRWLIREAFLWSNYAFEEPMVIIITIITPYSQKLKMSLTGTVKLPVPTAIVAHRERGFRGCSSLGQN